MEISILLIITSVTGCWCQSPWNDGQEYYDPLDEEQHLPVILSSGETFTRSIGDRVKLPCQIQNLGDYSVAWKRDETHILYVLKGTTKGIQVQKVVKDQRIKLKGTNLILLNLRPGDAHTYSCQIQLNHDHYKPRAIHHVVNVNVPPSIWATDNTTYIPIVAGETAILDCHTEGKPKPMVYWARKDLGRLRGRQEGSAFIIYDTERADSGDYKCVADNGVLPLASATITLEVKHPPEVETRIPVKHVGIGSDETLSCFVYANPKAKLEWFRDGAPINPMRLIQSVNTQLQRHSLRISKVLEEDLGFYTCNATNYYGKGSASIELTGRPGEVFIRSDSLSDSPDTYTLVWEVESYSPILHYVLSYKNVSDTDEQWVNLTIPSSPTISFVHTQSFNLSPLTPDSNYNIFITAKNEFGYNTVKEPFNFTTLYYDPTSYNAKIPELEESSINPSVEEPTMTSTDLDERKTYNSDETEDATINLSSHLVSQPAEDSGATKPSSSKKPYTGQNEPYSDTKLATASAAPEITISEKRAQTVAMITAISLSAFFL